MTPEVGGLLVAGTSVGIGLWLYRQMRKGFPRDLNLTLKPWYSQVYWLTICILCGFTVICVAAVLLTFLGGYDQGLMKPHP